jgi:nicotinate-nucleotide pyrophosphorylase (carboxylating)
VDLAIAEDVGTGDVTSEVTVSRDAVGDAVLEARQSLVVCGLDLAAAVFEAIDPRIEWRALARDGDLVEAGTAVAHVHGPLRGLLTAERTALNFLMRLSGVASHTRRFVEAVAGTGTAIVDTRKTLPGWRTLDKYATAVGGAENHRVGLYDGILLKDNHIAVAGGVGAAVKTAIAAAPAQLRVQVEVESEADARAALEAGADFLLLDNWSPEALHGVVPALRDRALLEVSGGVDLENVRAYAETGVQRISIGSLTHSAPAADLALEITQGAIRPGRVAT